LRRSIIAIPRVAPLAPEIREPCFFRIAQIYKFVDLMAWGALAVQEFNLRFVFKNLLLARAD
jgi:hypothetical protein